MAYPMRCGMRSGNGSTGVGLLWSACVWLASVPLTLILWTIVNAQAPVGSIGGSVSDSAGAVVGNAEIIVRSTDTAAERHTSTNLSGGYRVPNLPPGEYIVEARRQG